MARILLIDDDSRLVSHLRPELVRKGHEVQCLDEAELALELLAGGDFDLVLADNCLPGMTGLELLEALRQQGLTVPVILMTGHTTPDTAIRARKLGARDYFVKPLDHKRLGEELEPLVEQMLKISRLSRERVHLPPPGTGPPACPAARALLGDSERMHKVYKRIGEVADSDLPVLILGEHGTGKELVARALFQYSDRSSKSFVPVNCAAIPETLLESELFGHERGAFTEAKCRRIGKFEQADGGTILLDEIGDMSASLQAKLLRVLQEGEVVRLGGNEVLKVDVRVLACTNRDLEVAMREGGFRADLYYRLQTVKVVLPPLRERGADVELLAHFFLARETSGKGRPALAFHDTALEKLRAHPWRGNVRELESAVKLAARVCRGPQVLPDDLELGPATDACPAQPATGEDAVLAGLRQAVRAAWDSAQGKLWPHLREGLEHEPLKYALEKLGDNKTRVGEWLGMNRGTVIERIRAHQLE